MTDKSFGDHSSRNIVKNPLLSTAVTGLSIEDLTLNAVLVPVTPNQGQITRSDIQIGTQPQTLGHTENEFTNLPSGDLHISIMQSQPSIPNHPPSVDQQIPQQYDKKPEQVTATVSKASNKTDDDFDVNEYFARLQGTRYVSAPLHSHPDQKTNLAVEENLEEISLNDDKNVEVQQSLTADIAQNFSQLPTVLPHVASAVFSSFSNMLNLKSREQTPDEKTTYQDYGMQIQASSNRPYQEVQMNVQSQPGFQDVQFYGGQGLEQVQQVAKEIPPPPKEIPTAGTSNYRITTRKKYAQIPGLSSGTPQQIAFNPLTQNIPSYFTPPAENNEDENHTQPDADKIDDIKPPNETYNIFNPIDTPTASNIGHNVNITASHNQPNLYNVPKENEPKSYENIPPIQQDQVIPPPPMFSVQRKDSKDGQSGKSVLPPSVARRLGSNHPVMKQQVYSSAAVPGNIFVPTFDPTSTPVLESNISQSDTGYRVQMYAPNIQNVPISENVPQASQTQPIAAPIQKAPPILPPGEHSLHLSTKPPVNLPPPPTNITSVSTNKPPHLPPTSTNLPQVSTQSPMNLPPPSTNISSQTCAQSPPNIPSSSVVPPVFPPSLPTASQIFVPTDPGALKPEPLQSTSNLFSSPAPPSATSTLSVLTPSPVSLFNPNEPTSEPSKPLVEPPKATGNINFRMTKKRPQYYSGPIEGVGSISNSVKPVIAPVDTGSFHGAVFTPDQAQVNQNVPVAVPFDLSQKPEALYETLTSPSQYATNSGVHATIANPYDISQQSSCAQYEFANTQSYGQSYNTAFDLSRPSTEHYENKEEEHKDTKGVGIIGSLKSKLSNLDINKIQNTVSTFFDPAYNDTKKEEPISQDNIQYNQPLQEEHSNFEVYVPEVQPNIQAYNQTSPRLNVFFENLPYQNQHRPHEIPYFGRNIGLDANDNNIIPLYLENIPVIEPEASAENITTDEEHPADTLQYVKTKEQKDLEIQQSISFDSLQIQAFVKKMEEDDDLPADIANVKSSYEIETVGSLEVEYSDSNTFGDEDEKDNCIYKKFSFYNEKCKEGELFSPQNIDKTESDANMSFFENVGSLTVEYSKPQNVHMFNQHSDMYIFKNLEKLIGEEGVDYTYPKYEEMDVNNDACATFLEKAFSTDKNVEKCDISKKIMLGRKASVGSIGNNTTMAQVSFFRSSPPDMDKLKDSTPYFAESVESVSSLDEPEEDDTGYLNTTAVFETGISQDDVLDMDYVTKKLIENLTSPFPYVKPASVARGDTLTVPPLEPDVNAQYQEISDTISEEITNITEETIETIQIQSAVELLDNVAEIPNYGWTQEIFAAGDYSFKLDPNTMGFCGNNSLFFDNVAIKPNDEIKVEYTTHERLLPSQMSIPTAPPAEYDQKSDETGILDVHSIEQDAKKDFPIDDEYVIEPSKAAESKIDTKPKPEKLVQSFQQQERLKNLEEISEQDEHKQVLFEVPCQPISMASYFDTGNYAADTYYKNTMTSPLHNISIPPGFEEEYKRRLALAKKKEEEKLVPDTTTQTKNTSVTTYSTAHIMNSGVYTAAHSTSYTGLRHVVPVGFNVESNIANIVEDSPENLSEVPPVFEQNLEDKKDRDDVQPECSQKIDEKLIPQSLSTTSHNIDLQLPPKDTSSHPMIQSDENPTLSSIFGEKTDEKTELSGGTSELENTVKQETEIPKVFDQEAEKIDPPTVDPFGQNTEDNNLKTPDPDPLNFFSDAPTEAPESFNRLASYFSTPPKTDHAKSFFELSQSQNHYRHASESQTELYTSLMKDLTSVQNMTIPKEQTIRHVNYFTVEYDQAVTEFIKGDIKKAELAENEIDTDNVSVDRVVTNCRYCTKVIFDKDIKVRKAMNDNSERGNNSSPTMKDSTRQPLRDAVSVNFEGYSLHEENQDAVAGTTENRLSVCEYVPVKHHWFYRVDIEDKSIWRGFSTVDSRALENAFLNSELTENTLVATDGGRYDVNISGRLRIPVYWNDKPTNVRRCSWFYKGTTDARYVPYTEGVAEQLEEEYRHGVTTGEWHRRLGLPNGEVVVMHGPSVMVHFLHSDAFSTPPLFSFGKRVYRNPPKIRVITDQPPGVDHLIMLVHGAGEYRIQKEKDQSSSRPRVVRRGHDETEIEDPEPSSIDHLLLLCHGVGSACDMRFRSVEEVVEDFRATSLQLIQSHYRNSYDQGIVSRVEVLPISWHATLHSGETGVDRRLAQITLDSIPRLRNFTNDTVLDVLFYTSPVFCQTILDTVCKELNRIYSLFKQRNPKFNGGVSLGGHSLGSVILYDLLCHQANKEGNTSAEKQYVSGSAGTGQPTVQYSQLVFSPDALYALGSPIAMFESIRGVESLGSDFCLPTCKNFFNIFHPYDPIAYRIEPLINPKLRDLKPFLIPHHKGRKRMHLELKDTMARVGADIKQKVLDSLRNTWNKWKTQPNDGHLEKVVEEDLEKEQLCDEKEELARERELATPEMLGRLNSGRRVDHVLQEAPLEMINEYLFAMSSHVGYWESEDTMLLMLREIYTALGVEPDGNVPQPNMTVSRTRSLDGSSIVSKPTDYPSTSHGAT